MECENGEEEYIQSGFLVSCVSDEILGCMDLNGDLVRSGFYLLSNGRLYSCKIYENGRKAMSENKGINFKIT